MDHGHSLDLNIIQGGCVTVVDDALHQNGIGILVTQESIKIGLFDRPRDLTRETPTSNLT